MEVAVLPYWVQIVQAIGPTAIAVAALIITAYFAYRQWATARDKLRLDLFEKRYAYFIALRDFMIFVIQHSRPDQQSVYEFNRKMVGAEFVFSGELSAYIESVITRSQKLLAISNRLENMPIGEKRNKLVDTESEIFMSISNEFEHLGKRFGMSMSLGKM
jgi:hypothetical protein